MPTKLPPSVTLSEPAPGYPVLEICHPNCRAHVALHGGHLMDWQPAGAGDPVLYLSPAAVFREGKAIRGGVPVCWPWFNAHPSDRSKPSHGFFRSRFWELLEATEDPRGVRLALGCRAEGLALRIQLDLGAELAIGLSTRNESGAAVPVSGALHSYFRVGEIDRVSIEGLEDAEYLDTVGEPQQRRQQGPVRFAREVDRIYDSSSRLRLVDEALGRTVVVGKSGSPSTVVWNPWSDKAAALGDLPDEDYRHFVCIEAAIANDRAVVLEPGGEVTLATTVQLDEGKR